MSHSATTARPPLAEAIRSAVAPFLCSRLLVLVVLTMCQGMRFETIPAREGTNFHLTVELHHRAALDGLHRVLGSADAAWYLDLAKTGYDAGPFDDAHPHNWVFFPLLPLVLRGAIGLGADPVIFGAMLANLCFFAALVLLYRLARLEGMSEETSKRVLWLLALAPTSYFFSAPITESLFLLFVVGAWLAWRTEHAAAAGIAFALAVLTRPTGLLLAPAYGLEIWRRRKAISPALAAAALLPIVAAGAFGAYLWQLTGTPLAFALSQKAWGRPGGSLFELVTTTAQNIHVPILPWNFVWVNAAALLVTFGTAIVCLRRRQLSYALLVIVPELALLHTGTTLSAARITMVLFPVYFVAAGAIRSATVERIVFCVLVATLTLMVAMYGTLTTAGMA